METLISDGAAQGTDLVKDSDTAGFNADVIEASNDALVLVDMWAPWCGPCKQLGPILEKVVNSAGGAVKLVKIDIDQNPQIAQGLRVQSIPAVFAFKNGQPVDGFMGALPESKVKEFIAKHAGPIGPTPIEQALEDGAQALETLDFEIALTAFTQVLELDAENAVALGGLSRTYLHLGEKEAAANILEDLPDEIAGHDAVKQALAALAISENATDDGELASLKAATEKAPDDLQARLEYAQALIGSGDSEAGGAELLEIVRRDREWEEARGKTELLKLFEALGFSDPLTVSFRRKLSSILFS